MNEEGSKEKDEDGDDIAGEKEEEVAEVVEEEVVLKAEGDVGWGRDEGTDSSLEEHVRGPLCDRRGDG